MYLKKSNFAIYLGIACFLETWLSGGVGRSLGGYDETYFRTRVKEERDFYSVVGLETEGSTSDVDQGSTAYLYGTRFINYLALTYGYDKLVEFYNRTDQSETFYAKQLEKKCTERTCAMPGKTGRNSKGHIRRKIWKAWLSIP